MPLSKYGKGKRAKLIELNRRLPMLPPSVLGPAFVKFLLFFQIIFLNIFRSFLKYYTKNKF
jgi:hypothetical protein